MSTHQFTRPPPPGYFVVKNENFKVNVKYGFVLHTRLAWSPLSYGLAWFISGTSYDFRSSFASRFSNKLLLNKIKLPHVWETEIDKIRVITGNGIGIRFRSNINNAKVLMIVYLKGFIFIVGMVTSTRLTEYSFQCSDYRIPKSVFGYSENFFLWK